MRKRLLLVVLLCLWLPACSGLEVVSSRESTAADLESLFPPSTAIDLRLSCQITAGASSGYCLGYAGPLQVEQIVAYLQLQPVVAGANSSAEPSPPGASPQLTAAARGCLSPRLVAPDSPRERYWTGGSPARLKLKSGGQLESLLLVYVPANAQLCLQFSYAP